MMLSSSEPGNVFAAQRENCLLRVYSLIDEDALQDERFPRLGEENGWYRIDVNGEVGYVSQRLCVIGY